MKIKKDKLSLTGALTPSDDPTEFRNFDESDKDNALSAIKTLKEYLQQLKDEIYRALDAGYQNLSCFNTANFDEFATELNEKPSVFLEKAYTLQEFDSKGPKNNRSQRHIGAGIAITNFCNIYSANLNGDQKFLNDAGKMIGAINSSLSQLNRVEDLITSDKYELAAAAIPVLQGCFEAVNDSARSSLFIEVIPNQNFIMKLLFSFAHVISSLISNIKNLAKSKDEVDKELFQEMRSTYKP